MKKEIVYEGGVGKTLRNWIERNEQARQAVADVLRSGGFTFGPSGCGGGYEVGLRAGWRLPEGSGVIHGVAEATVAEVISKLKDLKPCDCPQCQREGKLSEEAAHCCACPHEDYLTISVKRREHECQSCGARFIEQREGCYFGREAER